MNNTNIALITHNGGDKFLFEVPNGTQVKQGDKVICETKKGKADGTALFDSTEIGGSALEMLVKLCGATLPLRKIVGKYDVIDFTESTQPTQPEQEDKPKFKVGDKVKVIDYGKSYSSYNDWFMQNPILSKMESRYSYWNKLKDGDICEVVAIAPHITDKFRILCAIETSENKICLINEQGIEPYVEPEKEPEPVYWSGKMICVQWNGVLYTPGMIYNVVNGRAKDNCGNTSNLFEYLNGEIKYHSGKFIEYKGEA